MKKNYWQDLVNKHLVGKKIVKVEWLNPKETERVFGWMSTKRKYDAAITLETMFGGGVHLQTM